MKHSGFVLWLTGLSGSGKSTLAERVVEELVEQGMQIERLEGDEIRRNLCKGLGFSKEDRDENIKRAAFVAKLLSRNGVGVVCDFISPYSDIRAFVKSEVTNYIEVFVDCPIDVCIRRDVKGLYKKAIAGEILNFTGITDPYQAPELPDVLIKTDISTVEQCCDTIINVVLEKIAIM